MATRTWIGTAAAIKEVYTDTIGGTWAAGSDTWTGTINGNDLVVTFGSGATVTTSAIASAIVLAWNGGTLPTGVTVNVDGGGPNIPEFNEITASASGSVVTFTHDTAGVPFAMTTAKSSTSGTVSLSNTVNATGPNWWDNVDNWDEGSVPTDSDDVIIDQPVSILYGIDQNAVTLTSLTIGPRFGSSSFIGLPTRNVNGYTEYRETFLKISATTLTSYSPSGRIKINVGTAQTTATIWTTGTAQETNRHAFQFLGTHASNSVTVRGGDVGIADNTGEASTVATIIQTGGTLTCGSNCTLTTMTKNAGTFVTGSAVTTLVNNAGTATVQTGSMTTLTAPAGIVNYLGTGTITTANLGNVIVNLGGATGSATFTNTTVNGDCIINDPNDRLVLTNDATISIGSLTRRRQ